jgi:hypothetical protein
MAKESKQTLLYNWILLSCRTENERNGQASRQKMEGDKSTKVILIKERQKLIILHVTD